MKQQEFKIEIIGNQVHILRCFTMGGGVVIPREIDGYPVTEIAPYAFSAHSEDKDPMQFAVQCLPRLCYQTH